MIQMVFSSIMSFFSKLLALLSQILFSEERHRLLLNSSAKDRYESKYGTTHPLFYTGTYKELINGVKNNLNFALIYLHAEDHEDTIAFCKETISNSTLSQLCEQKQIDFWIGFMDDPEPYEVASLLSTSGFPFIALIMLTRVEGVTRPAVVYRSEGTNQKLNKTDLKFFSIEIAENKEDLHRIYLNPLAVLLGSQGILRPIF
jgi:hypothetical protein